MAWVGGPGTEVYKTGRSRQLKYAGTLTSVQSSQWVCQDPGDPINRVVVQESYRRPSWSLGALGIELKCWTTEGGSIPPIGSCTAGSGAAGNHCSAEVIGISSTGDPGDVMTDYNLLTVETFSRPGGFSRPCEGTYEITLEVEEYVALTPINETDVDWSDVDGWPQESMLAAAPDEDDVDFYGASTKIGLYGYKAEFYEVAKAGTVAYGTISVDGNSASCQVAITGANAFPITIPFPPFPGDIDYGWRCVTRMGSFRLDEEAAATCEFCEYETLAAPWYQLETNGAFVDARTGCDANSPLSATLPTYSQCEVALFPTIEQEFQGQLRVFDAAYPIAQLARVRTESGGVSGIGTTTAVSLNPSGTLAYTQSRYGCDGDLNGVAATAALVDQWYPAMAWLDVDDLATNTEDPADWRLRFQLWPWHAANLLQDQTLAVAADETLTTANLAATLTETILEGYRYLEFDATSNYAAREHTLTIGQKEYKFTTGASGVSTGIVIDLCLPTNIPGPFDHDARDQRYPLVDQTTAWSPIDGVPKTDYATESDNGWMWGVLDRPTELALDALAGAETLALANVRLTRRVSNEATVAEPFKEVHGWDSPSDATWLVGLLWLYSDGKQVAMWPHMARVDPTGVGADTWEFWDLARLELYTDYIPGWTWDPQTAPSLPVLASDLVTPMLGEANLAGNVEPYLWDGAAWRNQAGMVPAGGSGAALWSCLCFDEIAIYPMCPAWGAAYGDGPFYLRSGKQLRSQAEGLAATPAMAVSPGDTAELKRVSDGLSRGTGLTDVQGVYRTGTPWGRDDDNHETVMGTVLETPFAIANRLRLRTSFVVIGDEADPLSYDVSTLGRHCIAGLSGGTVWLALFGNDIPSNPAFVDTGIAAVWCCARWDPAKPSRLYLWVEPTTGGGVDRYISTDEGATFSMATSIFADGGKPFGFIGRDGFERVYSILSGDVRLKIYDRGGALVQNVGTVVSGADDVAAAADESPTSQGVVRIALWVTVAGVLTRYLSTDGGFTYS